MSFFNNACMVWHTSSIKTIADAEKREVRVSTTGLTGNSAKLPLMLNMLLGTKFKVIAGYTSGGMRLAVERGGERVRGAVAASDAFFPFPDGLEVLTSAGVKAVVQPGGSVNGSTPERFLDCVESFVLGFIEPFFVIRILAHPAVVHIAANADRPRRLTHVCTFKIGGDKPPFFKCIIVYPACGLFRL